MNIEQLVGQRFCVGFQGLTAPDYILEWIREGRVGGIILFARNIESPEQVADLCRSLHEAAPTPLMIGIDQEGGMVARLRQPQGFTESPGAMALAAAQDGTEQSKAVSKVLGDEMRALGINWNYAPAVDLSYNADNPTVGTRSYGRDSQAVGELAAAAVKGFQAGGVAACAKHFPGLGNTSVDSHLDLPTLDTPVDDLLAQDLVPYRDVVAADIASIMTTHTIFSTLDEDYPATLSPIIIKQLLRDELGFEGVVTTDCLEMQAITKNYGAGESAVLAALAGVDILLVSHTRSMQEAAYDALLEAAKSGRLSGDAIETSQARIDALKGQFAIKADEINAASVGSEHHLQQAMSAAQKAIAVVKNDGAFPLSSGQKVGLVEFNSHMESEVMEREEPTSFVAIFKNEMSDVEAMAVHAVRPSDEQIQAAMQLADSVDTLVVVTRNAHLVAAQKDLAQKLMDSSNKSVLVALRNPYDADVLQADTLICTHGDSIPSLQAVAQALVGQFVPDGKRPTAATV